MDIIPLLRLCLDQEASDLHLSTGLPPLLRVHGDMRRLETLPPLRHDDILVLLQTLMDVPQQQHYARTLECDFARDFPGLGRFRVHAFRAQRGAAAVFRAIADEVRTLTQLNAPPLLAELALRSRGLVLVTGPTGSGKSTTLAAMVRHLNETEARHVLTVEDPIEFIHQPIRCLINQREVGAHTLSFANALRSALRADPDVILLGEMRDLDTMRLALTAAETGHLVLGTLHTSSAPKAVDRVIDLFPAGEKDLARGMLSESLLAVVAQVLCKTADARAPGRVAAYEVMTGTPAIRHLIREGKVAQMHTSLQTGAAAGMRTLDQHLAELLRRGTIDAAEAQRHARQAQGVSA
ncbi:twitching motility protein PilT [Hylemonella gracilis str. Niagara R]|uniref:Twitching motility protein PilT n=1 Tax=Hylemonella gracilis str. Niagara R TaxID=1458275 RepID=A0A016XD51_9BURK|nr:type IV pilus twitching motility protein PilT [Hylemonella gracilis]EYC50009.1 twitching motility protein PilT [Hylemonella gracilis str. Niagara R]